ncbi:MAG: RcnB family protein [Pseudomonadota bacterium]
MKKFILATIAASMLATPVLAAPAQNYGGQRGPQQNHRVAVHKPAPVQQYRSWQRGQRFDSRYARNYRQVDYRTHRNLRAPPRGYRYVQSGNDAVLVALGTGIIAAIFANALR